MIGEVLAYQASQNGDGQAYRDVLSSYDSSADYWRVSKKKGGGYEIFWDKNTNLDISELSEEERKALGGGLSIASDKINDNAAMIAKVLGGNFNAAQIATLGNASEKIDAVNVALVTYMKDKESKTKGNAAVIAEELKAMKFALTALGGTGIVSGVVPGMVQKRTPEELSKLLGGSGTLDDPYGPITKMGGKNQEISSLQHFRLVVGEDFPDSPSFPPNQFAKNEHAGIDYGMKARETDQDRSYYAAMDGTLDLQMDPEFGLQSLLGLSNGNSLHYAHGGSESIMDFVTAWSNGGAGAAENGIGVIAGTVIGHVGQTGNSDKDHLHLGYYNKANNPVDVLDIGNGGFYKEDRFKIGRLFKYTEGYSAKLPYDDEQIISNLSKAKAIGVLSDQAWTSYLKSHSAELIKKYGMKDYRRMVNGL